MPRTTAFANDYLEFICQGAAITTLSGVTQLWLSLHTSSPDLTGNQSTNECAYTSYGRVAVGRNSTGLPITDNVAGLGATAEFPTATGGSETATYFGIGTNQTGSGYLLWYGALSPTIPIASGTTPKLSVGTTITAV